MKLFKNLFEPLQIKHVKFRNRLVKPAQRLCYADSDGMVGQRNLDFYETIARGGVGAIIVEHAYVDFPLGKKDTQISIADDRFIPSLAALAEVIHKHGCPVIQQISHAGPAHNSYLCSEQAVAPSALSEEYMNRKFSRTYNIRPLTRDEIEAIICKFADAAVRAQRAGFDGVEIHAAAEYLLRCFLSREWNKRDDEYGCQTMQNRTRLVVAVLRAIRERVGQDFMVGVRLDDGGVSLQEHQQIAASLETAGADYFHMLHRAMISQLAYPEKPAPISKELSKAAELKKVISVPFIVVGGLDPALAESVIKKGIADAASLGRRLLADPDLPNKLMEGKPEDIRPCTTCGTCLDLLVQSKPITCRVNAALGKERESEIKTVDKPKRVVVVGSGPAGMESARVAALRGHEVTLYEKEPKMGGLLPLAALIKGTEIDNISPFVNYLRTQIIKLGVTIRLSEEYTTEVNKKLKPEVVIIATGGRNEYSGEIRNSRKNIITSEKLYRLVKFPLRLLGPSVIGRLTRLWLPIGKKVVIIGGSLHGCQVAEFLVKRGRIVTIMEASDQLGIGLLEINRRPLLDWLARKNVAMFTNAKRYEPIDRGLIMTTNEDLKQTIEADSIIIATAPQSNNILFRELKGKKADIYLIGDSNTPRLIADAIAEGFQTGRTV